jgi:hypothetical protein
MNDRMNAADSDGVDGLPDASRLSDSRVRGNLEFPPRSSMVYAEHMNDTHPAAHAILIEGYRRMTPAQKLERVSALCRTVRELALADIRRRYPGAGEREISMRLASRWLDAATMRSAFGWDPALERT